MLLPLRNTWSIIPAPTVRFEDLSTRTKLPKSLDCLYGSKAKEVSVAISIEPISFIDNVVAELCSPLFTSILCLILVTIAGVVVVPAIKMYERL